MQSKKKEMVFRVGARVAARSGGFEMPKHSAPGNPDSAFLWWVRHILLAVAGLFFLGFGIQLLMAAYGLQNPFYFVMTFFASNLIILISAALLAGFIFRMVAALRPERDDTE